MTQTYTQIEAEVIDGALLLTLDRPEKLNAWTPTMSAELVQAIEAADADPAIGAVIVTGRGRGFCAGADIEAVFGAQIAGDDAAARPKRTRDWVELVQSTKPLIAAVNGVAVGVGLTMILPFDRIIVSTEARLSLRFVKMGLVPELGSSQIVPQRVGYGTARDLMLSGRMVGGAEAVEIGLADELAEPDQLIDAALAKAAEYGENPARQLRWIKQLLAINGAEAEVAAAQRRELELLEQAYVSPEHAEAVAAFTEKRKPDFSKA
ncbi:MAG: enoyl-CoA hydratase-related protein [Acidimicrobiales bacterium]